MASPKAQAPLIDPSLMFRFRVPCWYTDGQWDDETGLPLDESYRLPCFTELDGVVAAGGHRRKLIGDFRLAWNERGLYFGLEVRGKRMDTVSTPLNPDTSDGVQVFVDTRDSKDIRRANRFCHRFFFGPRTDSTRPVVNQYPVQRAKEHAPRMKNGARIWNELRGDGYVLQGYISKVQLNGFDPEEHPRLGFSYLIRDREHGYQPFSVGMEYRFPEDPSLWGSLELLKS